MTSPLPWKVGECSDDQKMILSANDKYVCSVQIWQTPRRMGYDMEKERLANAAFIVRACNNHERLISACKKAMAELIFPACGQKHSKLYEELQQVLQSAEGK
jgi:hypothetical protein